MLLACRISAVSAHRLITLSPRTFVLGSQKLVGSQPPSACTKTKNLPR